MKSILFLILLCISQYNVQAQVPEKMSYQAIIRDASNALIANGSVGMKISILEQTATGTAVFSETQTVTTNENGLISIEIGTGTIITGAFSSINWASGLFFLKTEVDPAGGTNYSLTSTSQLLTVPFAMYAKTAGGSGNSKTLIYTGF